MPAKSRTACPHSPGNDPCTELETRAGVWRYDANKPGQMFSPKERYASGIRNAEGFDFDTAGRLFVTQHGRDQLHENWPKLYTAEQGFDLPAEEVMIAQGGRGLRLAEMLLRRDAEEAGAGARIWRRWRQEGRRSAPTGEPPVAAFPAHWAPNDLKIYKGRSSRRPIRAAPSSPSTARGTARRVRKAAITSCSSRWRMASRPATTSSSPMVLPAATRTPAAPPTARPASRSDPTARSTLATTRRAASGASPTRAIRSPGHRGCAGASRTCQQHRPSALPPEGVHPDAGSPAALPVPPGSTPDQVALGKKVFHGEVAGATCAGCHGADGIGTPVGADLTAGPGSGATAACKSITDDHQEGVPEPKQHPGAMPPLGGVSLTDPQLAAVAACVWAIGHRKGG